MHPPSKLAVSSITIIAEKEIYKCHVSPNLFTCIKIWSGVGAWLSIRGRPFNFWRGGGMGDFWSARFFFLATWWAGYCFPSKFSAGYFFPSSFLCRIFFPEKRVMFFTYTKCIYIYIVVIAVIVIIWSCKAFFIYGSQQERLGTVSFYTEYIYLKK